MAENLGDKVVDIIESALSPLDGRSEVMEMCLQSSTGEYKAIEIAATGDSEALGQWEAGSAGQTMTASTGLRGDTYMTSAQGGGRGVPQMRTTVLISCVTVTVTRGGLKIRKFCGRH